MRERRERAVLAAEARDRDWAESVALQLADVDGEARKLEQPSAVVVEAGPLEGEDAGLPAPPLLRLCRRERNAAGGEAVVRLRAIAGGELRLVRDDLLWRCLLYTSPSPRDRS